MRPMDDVMLDAPEADEPALSPEELRKAQLAAKAPVLTGSGAILKSLEMLGVTDVFGLPGGAIMPFYDELMSADKIRHILVRHEQGA
ncbi:thiamine pyrophosphate-binding protein, partial [Pontimonas sp.]